MLVCLCRLLGISLRDRVRNEDIRQKTGTTRISEYIKRNRSNGLHTSADYHQTAYHSKLCYTDTVKADLEADHENDRPPK